MEHQYPHEKQQLLSGELPQPNDRRSRHQISTTHRVVVVALGLVVAVAVYFSHHVLSCHAPASPAPVNETPEYSNAGWFPSPKGGTVASWSTSYRKASELVSRMSLLEKVNITTGIGWAQGLCVGNTAPAVHVGFPSLCLQDGPLGLRFADRATAWPAGLTVGATWNRELMFARGAGHGEEAREKGVNMILSPCIGPLGRMPAGGRNWEGFGPDPYLQGVAASETIRGIQSEGVIATAKHFILNEQEHFRQILEWKESSEHAISSNVDDRTMHELYLWPFADSVKAGVASVMCSYNQINNTYACGNSKALNGLLKDELGFNGFVQSDWYAQRDGIGSILGGLDVTMPGNIVQNDGGNTLFGANLTAAVLNSSIPIERLDDMATRVVAAWYQLGQDDKEKFPDDGPNFSSWTDEEEDYVHHGAGEGPRKIVNKHVDVRSDHWKTARQVAMEGTVLVKNSGILPLRRGHYKNKHIGIYGEDAGSEDQYGFPNFCEDRSCNKGSLGSGWGSGAVEYTQFRTPLSALKTAFHTTPSDIPHFTAIPSNSHISSTAKSAKSQDLCFAFVNSDAGEGYITDPETGVAGDRLDLYAQKNGDELVLAVADNCPDTIVVVHAVGPVLVERWIEHPHVRAVLLAHLPGEESGAALAPLLFGDESPSGKLPYTVGKSLDDYGPTAKVMYHPNSTPPQQNFTEGLEVDYRYFDAHNISPRYEFGFGLSYTRFDIHSPKLELKRERSPFPSPRPELRKPPKYDSKLPEVQDALFPKRFKRVKKYIYPYLSSSRVFSRHPYRLPKDYNTPRSVSPAGGGEGGNPSLWDTVATLEVSVKNTGERTGNEVVQLYVSFPPDFRDDSGEAVKFPVKVLRGFEKVRLASGEERKVVFEVKRRELSYWDVRAQNWRIPHGKFTLRVGSSSRDLPVELEF